MSNSADQNDEELDSYSPLLSWTSGEESDTQRNVANKLRQEELDTAPLVHWKAKTKIDQNGVQVSFGQYAVLGQVLDCEDLADKPVLLNTGTPWSAFLCGSQGSGKSHALSCMLENCLLSDQSIGKNPEPLAGLVFHYDSNLGNNVCEAAYLSSKIPTTVLVSPSYYAKLKDDYERVAQQHNGNITVEKLRLHSQDLNIERMKKLMAVTKDGEPPLYLQVLFKLLRDMAIETDGKGTLDYADFKRRLGETDFMKGQTQPLAMRIDLLESFLDRSMILQIQSAEKAQGKSKATKTKRPTKVNAKGFLAGKPGTLTIIDLTDPLVDPEFACTLFSISLSIFITRTQCSKIVALDEAHNYLIETSAAASEFTAQLLATIREQRHNRTRVVIATQEPGINEKLLDLCSITMVHRCTSPAWFAILKRHLAGLYLSSAKENDGENGSGNIDKRIMQQIVELKLGESLLFCANAITDVESDTMVKMGQGRAKFRTRKRLTADGGKTQTATRTESSEL